MEKLFDFIKNNDIAGFQEELKNIKVLYLDIKKLLHYAISLDNIEFVVYIIDNLYIEVDRELLIYYRKKIKETTKGMEQYLKKLESKIYQYSNCTEGFIHQGIFKDDIELLDTLYDLGLIYNDYKHIITIEMAVKEIRNNHKNEILEMIIKNSKDKLNLDKYIQEKLLNHLINRKLLESLKLSIKKELIQKQVLQENIQYIVDLIVEKNDDSYLDELSKIVNIKQVNILVAYFKYNRELFIEEFKEYIKKCEENMPKDLLIDNKILEQISTIKDINLIEYFISLLQKEESKATFIKRVTIKAINNNNFLLFKYLYENKNKCFDKFDIESIIDAALYYKSSVCAEQMKIIRYVYDNIENTKNNINYIYAGIHGHDAEFINKVVMNIENKSIIKDYTIYEMFCVIVKYGTIDDIKIILDSFEDKIVKYAENIISNALSCSDRNKLEFIIKNYNFNGADISIYMNKLIEKNEDELVYKLLKDCIKVSPYSVFLLIKNGKTELIEEIAKNYNIYYFNYKVHYYDIFSEIFNNKNFYSANEENVNNLIDNFIFFMSALKRNNCKNLNDAYTCAIRYALDKTLHLDKKYAEKLLKFLVKDLNFTTIFHEKYKEIITDLEERYPEILEYAIKKGKSITNKNIDIRKLTKILPYDMLKKNAVINETFKDLTIKQFEQLCMLNNKRWFKLIISKTPILLNDQEITNILIKYNKIEDALSLTMNEKQKNNNIKEEEEEYCLF